MPDRLRGPYPPGPDFADLARANALQGPAQYLFTGEDGLQVDVFSRNSNLNMVINGAMLGEGQQLLPFSVPFVAPGGGAISTVRFSVDSGWLQHVRVIENDSGIFTGQTFVWVRKVRGITANAIVLGTIASGYVTQNTDLYWPGGTTLNPTDGAGAPLRFQVTTPAAGVDWSFTVGGGQRLELIGVSGLLTAAAAVANRQPELVLDDSANIFFAAPTQTNITANQTSRVSWGAGAGGPLAGVNLDQSLPVPNDLYLPAGFRVRVVTTGLQAADTWTLINLFARQWIEGS